jgi:hypothetical protein
MRGLVYDAYIFRVTQSKSVPLDPKVKKLWPFETAVNNLLINLQRNSPEDPAIRLPAGVRSACRVQCNQLQTSLTNRPTFAECSIFSFLSDVSSQELHWCDVSINSVWVTFGLSAWHKLQFGDVLVRESVLFWLMAQYCHDTGCCAGLTDASRSAANMNCALF